MKPLLPLVGLFAISCSVSTLSNRPIKDSPDREKEERRGAAPSDVNNDAPEISRGVGEPGGVVILWSRSIKKDSEASLRSLAETARARLDTVARRALGDGAAIDSRPEPERVCPQVGCKAASVQLVVSQKSKGCALVAVVSPPGRAAGKIIPLAGTVRLTSDEALFREPPENAITITEFASCEDVERALKEGAPLEGEASLEKAIAAAAKR
jgi:hypothetical protein